MLVNVTESVSHVFGISKFWSITRGSFVSPAGQAGQRQDRSSISIVKALTVMSGLSALLYQHER